MTNIIRKKILITYDCSSSQQVSSPKFSICADQTHDRINGLKEIKILPTLITLVLENIMLN